MELAALREYIAGESNSDKTKKLVEGFYNEYQSFHDKQARAAEEFSGTNPSLDEIREFQQIWSYKKCALVNKYYNTLATRWEWNTENMTKRIELWEEVYVLYQRQYVTFKR